MHSTIISRIFLLSAITLFSSYLQAQAVDKPNIVLIMVDDGRYDEYRPTGAPDWFVAPSIERIANEGVNFNRTYAPTPLCGPSRASVYTGLYSHQHGTGNNGTDLDTTLTMIQDILISEGYYTGFIGKYGNNFPAPNEFDYWVDLGDSEDYKNTWIKVNGVNTWVPGHITNSFNEYIHDFFDSVSVHSDKPFALFFFPLAPHTPNTPRAADAGLYIDEVMPFPENFQEYETLYPSFYKEGQTTWVKDSVATENFIMDRFACLIGVEDNVSQIFARLDTSGQTDSSFILFTSDNGYISGEHKMRAKALPIEESIRIPMFVRYPEWFPTPAVIDNDMVEIIDIAKTVVDVLGIPDTFNFSGHSLKTIAEPDTTRKYVFYQYEGAEPDDVNEVPDLRGVRSFDHLYVYSNCDCWTEEFYDFNSDPLQDTNQILNPAYYPLVQQYRAILDSLKLAYGDTMPYVMWPCNLEGAYEIPDGIDNDCDGITDDSLDAFMRYFDADGDGFGDPDSSLVIFGELPGFVANALDCTDTLNDVNPSSVEICDDIDNDCDGLIDDDDPDVVGMSVWYFDGDMDGYGDNATAVTSCFPPLGYIITGNDCDDSDPADTLAYAEICNLIDDDCDGLIDDLDPDVTGQDTWYADMDGDGVGDYATIIVSCTLPEGYIDNYGDCNDADSTVTHGSPEVCNLLDDDCDGLTDDADPDVTDRTWYFYDNDGDGFGDQAVAQLFCFGGAGYVEDSTDCNDLHALISPVAIEICDGLDNDCDGLTDDNDPSVVGASFWYQDFDNDGYGNFWVWDYACFAPPGYVPFWGDCNDFNPDVHPGVPDYCDMTDNDCDFFFDEDILIPTVTADGPLVFCKGESVTFTASPVVPGYDIQWFKSGIPIAGATSSSYTATTSGNYKVEYTGVSWWCVTYSSVSAVTVNNTPKPSISTTSPTNDLCLNNPVKLSTKNKLGSTYQWFKGASMLAGATTNKYNATTSGNYKVEQTDINGCVGLSKSFSVVQTCREIAPYIDDEDAVFTIYPNPNDGLFMIDVNFGGDLSGDASIKIYSLIGELVFESWVTAENGLVSTAVQIQDIIPSGMYIIEASLQQQRLFREVVIE